MSSKRQILKILFCVFLLLLSVCLSLTASADEKEPSKSAFEITQSCVITLNEKRIPEALTDNQEQTYIKYKEPVRITVRSPEPIGGIYLKFDRTPPEWMLIHKEDRTACGQYGFLHEYQPIEEDDITEVSLIFEETVSICDFFVLSKGEKLPDFVQVWRPAKGKCDIMLLSTHSDDDQLFFAGTVPDAVSRGAEMQVCYFTNHWNTHTRPHELLNGLWTCGLDRYPVVSPFRDSIRVDSEAAELAVFEAQGVDYADMVQMQVELLREFKPQIVLVHDVDGEYGHGAHILNSHSLRDALPLASDATKYPESAEKYGVWDPLKVYIHLYDSKKAKKHKLDAPLNTIDFEIDVPLEFFGGRTAYQVSQDAFRCHISQFKSRYRIWLLGTDDKPVTKASQFPQYNPRYYGLYYSTVGKDKIKTDFYENIVLLKDQKPGISPSSSAVPSDVSGYSPHPTVLHAIIAESFLCILTGTVALILRTRRKRMVQRNPKTKK